MYIIGERINGMFKDVAAAINAKNKSLIQSLAKNQIECGANALDINVGPASSNPREAMEWLIKTVSEVTDITLVIDTTKTDVMESGLALCKSRPIINSINANEDKMKTGFELAKRYNASIIALTMDKSGIPNDADGRIELAMKIAATAVEYGISAQDLYIDAVILPVNVAQNHGKEVLRTIREIKLIADPPPKTVLGLSNISQGSFPHYKGLINRIFLVMAIVSGLDAAIMDARDKELVDAAITAELLVGKQLYCDSYLDAYRKG